MKKTSLIFLILFCLCPFSIMAQQITLPIIPAKETVKPLFGNLLSDVSISKSSFNPTLGEETAISYTLSKPAKITVHVYDPDNALIKIIANEKQTEAGKQTLIWNGKDTDSHTVPDEAYFFTIIAKDESEIQEIYDPTTFSGGMEHDITNADVDPQSHTITYKMPEMGRVMIRMGVESGPLLNQLVDWEPRVKGMITEYWNGKDKDNLADIYSHPKFKMIIVYFTLPENSVISFGNKSVNYRDYKKTVASERALKPNRISSVYDISRHYQLARTIDYEPRLKVEFNNLQGDEKDGTFVLKEKTLVKVELDEADKAVFQNHQFEICFFLDYEFYAEDEAGYTPFNWVWDISNVKEGEHLLTVNLSTFKDQIGVLSHKVKVVK